MWRSAEVNVGRGVEKPVKAAGFCKGDVTAKDFYDD